MQSIQLITQEILTRLQEASSKQSLNDVAMLIRSLGDGQESLELPLRLEMITLLREKILESIYQKGDIPDCNLLWCYGIFGDSSANYAKEIPQDTRFDTYVDLAKFIKNTESNYERLLMINCVSVAMLLRGENERAIQFFLRQIIYLDLSENYMAELNAFVLEFLFYYKVPIEWILEVQKEALEEESFYQLPDRQKKSVFLWSMHIFWNVKHYFNHLKWCENFPVWLGVLKRLLEQGNLDLAMYVEFYIYHKFGNSAQTQEDWQEYNDKVVKLVEPYFVEYGKSLPKCKEAVDRSAGRKVKIGILKDRIVENSPYKVEYSLIKALCEDTEFANNYEIVVYSMAYIQKSMDDMEAMKALVEVGASVVSPTYGLIQEYSYYVPHLQKAMLLRERILEDKIDILISTGTIDGSDFLFATRSAPKQIFWTHGNGRYDIAGIDERISHCAVEDRFTFKQFFVPMDKERFYNPPRPPETIEAEKAKYPIKKDTIVLGVIGRLVKVDSEEYLEAIAEVMQKHKNTIFIAAGAGNIPVIRKKVEELGISERFFMPGFVDPHIYGHIIDIFCNTFPLQQGESISEFAAKGRIFIQFSFQEEKFKILAKDFSEEIMRLKYSNRILIFIKNIQEYEESLKNWDTILNAEDIILCYYKRDKEIISKLKPLKCHFFEINNKINLADLADLTFQIKEKGLYLVGDYRDFNLFIRKPAFRLLAFYNDYEIYNEYYSKILFENRVLFEEKSGWIILKKMLAYTKKQYIENLSEMLINQELRSNLRKCIDIQQKYFFRKNREIFTRDFLKILEYGDD